VCWLLIGFVENLDLDSCRCWSFVGGAFFLLLTCNYWVFYCLVIDWVLGGVSDAITILFSSSL